LTEVKYTFIDHTDWIQHQPSTQVFSKFQNVVTTYAAHPYAKHCYCNTFREGYLERRREMGGRDRVMATDKTPKKKNFVALVRERTIPTERPPPVGEVSANFCE